MVQMKLIMTSDGLEIALAGLGARALDLRPAMDEIGAMLMTSTDLRFERQVDPDGTPWTPNAPSTAKRKAKLGRELVLQMSGRLRGSITRQAESNSVTVGANLVYAGIHQRGGTIDRAASVRQIYRKFVETKGKGGAVHRELLPGFVKKKQSNFETSHDVGAHSITIPARPFLGINRQDREGAVEILQRFIADAPGANP